MHMSWEYLMLQDVLKMGKGGGNITIKKLWVWSQEFCPSYL